jgi:hypothetical protein
MGGPCRKYEDERCTKRSVEKSKGKTISGLHMYMVE